MFCRSIRSVVCLSILQQPNYDNQKGNAVLCKISRLDPKSRYISWHFIAVTEKETRKKY